MSFRTQASCLRSENQWQDFISSPDGTTSTSHLGLHINHLSFFLSLTPCIIASEVWSIILATISTLQELGTTSTYMPGSLITLSGFGKYYDNLSCCYLIMSSTVTVLLMLVPA